MTKLVFRPIVRYHRNGVHGEGFYCIVFDDHRQRIRANHLVAAVFETEGTVAVMCPVRPFSRWRGDLFEAELRAAIAAAPDSELFGSD